jgi:hypothetical protein
MTGGLRFIASGEHAFGPIARWRDPGNGPAEIADLGRHAEYAQWAETGLWKPDSDGDLRGRLGLPPRER